MLIKSLLEPDYDARFDDVYFPSPANRLLRGVALVIQDNDPIWRPGAAELVSLLPESLQANVIILASATYESARILQDSYPGPAILLYGAALNAIGGEDPIDLPDRIQSAEHLLAEHDLLELPEIQNLVNRAYHSAQLEVATRILEQELTRGLTRSGKYSREEITAVTAQILEVVHDLRYKPLVYQFGWAIDQSADQGYFSADPREIARIADSSEPPFTRLQRMSFGRSFLRHLVSYAQVGCGQALLAHILDRRIGKF